MDRIRVLVADDHAMVREGIRHILALHDDIEVVGEAADGKEAIDQTRTLAPDVVLLDIAMPGLGGLEAALEIRRASPQSKVLVLTQYDNKEYVRRFLKAGAAGYLLKKAAGTELVTALRAVYQGGSFLDSSITPTIIEGYLEQTEQGVDLSYNSLTDREKQVLKLVAEGQTNKQIAEMLGLSIKTVMSHRASLMDKLGLHNRADLVKYAIRKGLITV